MLKSIAWDIALLLFVFFVVGCIIGCIVRRNWTLFFGGSKQRTDAPATGHSVTESGKRTSQSDDTAAAQPAGMKKPRAAGADDLKRIKGVGPVLEKKLNVLGYYHFDQIAAWTPQNIAWVDDHLNFKGRIDRDKWIEQVKELMP